MAAESQMIMTYIVSVAGALMTFDPVNKGSGTTISSGSGTNRNASITSLGIAIGNIFHATGTGKYYCEIQCTYSGGDTLLGFIGSTYVAGDLNNFSGHALVGWAAEMAAPAVYNHGNIIRTTFTGSNTASGFTYLFAFDAGVGNLYLGIFSGGVSYWYNSSGGSTTFASATPLNLTPVSGNFTVAVGFGAAGTETYILNSGQSSYLGTVPSGYTNW